MALGSTEFGKIVCERGGTYVCERGIRDSKNSILWEDVERIYLSGSINTLEYIIPAGETQTIRIVDTYKNSVEITLSGFFRMSEAKRQEFIDVYKFILQNVGDHQWTQFLQSLTDGERVSFGRLDVAHDGIYYLYGTKYKLIEEKSILGYDIDMGEFYIQYLKDNNKPTKEFIGYIENIPNIHILQTYINKKIGE